MSLINKLKLGLTKTSTYLKSNIIQAVGLNKINDDTITQIESILISSDLGVEATTLLINKLKESVIKTGKVLIIQESNNRGGFGSDIASFISENLFEYLDAPIVKVSSLDTPIPFTASLEDNYLAKSRLSAAFEKLISF